MTVETAPHKQRHPIRAVRIIRARPRLSLSVALGLVTILFLFLTCDWRTSTKLLIGWNIGVGLYLILAFYLMARSDVHRIRRRAALQDEGQLTMLALTVTAAAASLAAIFFELGTSGGTARQPIQLILATATIVLSWAFIHMMFALHYAHEYYGEGRDHTTGGMTFPGSDEPDYWDFTYFAFVIGMTFQVADVAITDKGLRRVALVQGVVAFFFNVVVLAFTINILAGMI